MSRSKSASRSVATPETTSRRRSVAGPVRASRSTSTPAKGKPSQRASGAATPQARGKPSQRASGAATPQARGKPSQRASGAATPQAKGKPSQRDSGAATPQAKGRPSQRASGAATPRSKPQANPVRETRKPKPICVGDAAALVLNDEAEDDDLFDPLDMSSTDEDDYSTMDDDGSASEVSLEYTPGQKGKCVSLTTCTPKRVQQSRGEPSSRGTRQVAEPASKRGRACEPPKKMLSAKKIPSKSLLTPRRTYGGSISRLGSASGPKALRASEEESGNALGKTSTYKPAMCALAGLGKYACYSAPSRPEATIDGSFLMEEAVTSVCREYPERENVIRRLAMLIGAPDSVPPSCLYIVGHTACGKTSIVKSVLQALNVFHVWVDGKECYSQDVLFTLVMSRLSEGSVSSALGDDNDLFIRQLESRLASSGHNRMILVIDNVHRFLRFSSVGPIPVLQRLYSLVSKKIGVVLISSLPWEDLWPNTQSTVPLQMRFPNYTQDELVAILSRDCPVPEQSAAFHTFVQLFCSCSKLSCVNLRQLRHLIHVLYPVYYKPVLSGDVDSSEKHELWRRLLPVQRRIVNNFFQHSSRTETVCDGVSRQYAAVDLPYLSKYLVLAGYLASHNPSTLDTQLFTKFGDRMSKRQRHAAKKPGKKDTDYQREGPKVFPLHRLMAIFFSIVDQPVAPSAHLFSQVASLVSLRIFSQENEATRAMDDPHYMCLVSEDVAIDCARSVDFDLGAVQGSV